jgi:hypothetical protein
VEGEGGDGTEGWRRKIEGRRRRKEDEQKGKRRRTTEMVWI